MTGGETVSMTARKNQRDDEPGACRIVFLRADRGAERTAFNTRGGMNSRAPAFTCGRPISL